MIRKDHPSRLFFVFKYPRIIIIVHWLSGSRYMMEPSPPCIRSCSDALPLSHVDHSYLSLSTYLYVDPCSPAVFVLNNIQQKNKQCDV